MVTVQIAGHPPLSPRCFFYRILQPPLMVPFLPLLYHPPLSPRWLFKKNSGTPFDDPFFWPLIYHPPLSYRCFFYRILETPLMVSFLSLFLAPYIPPSTFLQVFFLKNSRTPFDGPFFWPLYIPPPLSYRFDFYTILHLLPS